MDTKQLLESVSYIRSRASSTPSIGIVLGSGLGDFADALPDRVAIPTTDIPHYPVSTVEGHKGKLVFATLNRTPILAFQGRIHFYEANNLETVLYPIRVARELGIKTLILTNAAGGMNPNFEPGDLMVLTDQLNFTLQNAPNLMAASNPTGTVYSARLIAKAEQAARSKGILVKKGVYVGLKGPSYETGSEVRMLSLMGGDAVGMSTVFEASLAVSLGMEILGISCITNLGTGISAAKLSHAEVTEVGNRVKKTFADLVASTIGII